MHLPVRCGGPFAHSHQRTKPPRERQHPDSVCCFQQVVTLCGLLGISMSRRCWRAGTSYSLARATLHRHAVVSVQKRCAVELCTRHNVLQDGDDAPWRFAGLTPVTHFRGCLKPSERCPPRASFASYATEIAAKSSFYKFGSIMLLELILRYEFVVVCPCAYLTELSCALRQPSSNPHSTCKGELKSDCWITSPKLAC